MGDREPLTIVVTRPADDAEIFARECADAGFETVLVPAIEIGPVPLDGIAKTRIAELEAGAFRWIVFSSRHAVRALAATGAFPSETAKLVAVGERTADELRGRFGRDIPLVGEAGAEELAEELVRLVRPDEAVLFVRGSSSLEAIPRILRVGGAKLEELTMYENRARRIPPNELDSVLAHNPDRSVVSFFSPSAVVSFTSQLRAHGPTGSGWLAAARAEPFGPTTERAVREAGLVLWKGGGEVNRAKFLERLRARDA